MGEADAADAIRESSIAVVDKSLQFRKPAADPAKCAAQTAEALDGATLIEQLIPLYRGQLSADELQQLCRMLSEPVVQKWLRIRQERDSQAKGVRFDWGNAVTSDYTIRLLGLK